MKKILFLIGLTLITLNLSACGREAEVDQSPQVTTEAELDAELSREPSEVINDAREVASYFYFDNHNPNYYDESISISDVDNKVNLYVSPETKTEEEFLQVSDSEISVSDESGVETSVAEITVQGETSPVLTVVDEGNKKTEDNRVWCKVVDVRFNTTEAAKKFLRTQFSSSLADKILSQAIKNEIFKEVDGNLFALVGDGGRLVDSTEYTVKSQTKNRIVYKVVVRYFADEDENGNPQYETKEYDFVREKINGEWIFTKFDYIW